MRQFSRLWPGSKVTDFERGVISPPWGANIFGRNNFFSQIMQQKSPNFVIKRTVCNEGGRAISIARVRVFSTSRSQGHRRLVFSLLAQYTIFLYCEIFFKMTFGTVGTGDSTHYVLRICPYDSHCYFFIRIIDRVTRGMRFFLERVSWFQYESQSTAYLL